MERVVLGLRAHSGWAALVALGGAVKRPEVIHRRRIEMADGSGAAQPYHAAAEMGLEEAAALLDRCAASARAMAEAQLRETAAAIKATDCCVLLGSGRRLPELRAILASHPLIHTAEGEFFRAALRDACEAGGLAVSGVKEKEVWGQAAAALRLPAEELKRRVAEMGKSAGPPWREDEKLCAAAGWLVMARPVS